MIQIEADFRDSTFKNATIIDEGFVSCIFRDVDFTGATLTNVQFFCCDLRGANFEGATLEKVDMTTSVLEITDSDKLAQDFLAAGVHLYHEKYPDLQET